MAARAGPAARTANRRARRAPAPGATTSPSPSTMAWRRAPGRELDVVGGEHDGAAAVRVLRDRALERVARRGVHAARRLVEQEQVGAAHRDRGDRDPLALAAREAARVVVGEVGEPERVEPVVDRAVVAPAEQAQRLGELGPDRRARTASCSGPAARRPPWAGASIRPGVGREQAAERARSSVVLPAPLRPSSATTSPAVDLDVDRRAAPGDGRARRRAVGRAAGARRAPRAVWTGRRARAGASIVTARARASRTVSGGGSQPSSRPSRVTLGAPG